MDLAFRRSLAIWIGEILTYDHLHLLLWVHVIAVITLGFVNQGLLEDRHLRRQWCRAGSDLGINPCLGMRRITPHFPLRRPAACFSPNSTRCDSVEQLPLLSPPLRT